MAAATPATSFDEESVSSGTGSRSALRGLLPVQYNDPVAVLPAFVTFGPAWFST